MIPRYKSSWTFIVLALVFASEGHAFSPSSLQSRTLQSIKTPPAIHKLTISNSGVHNRKRHLRPPSLLQALPDPTFLITKACSCCFAPPVTSLALRSITALSAMAATIAGGVFAGSLHAIAGPDHLAALIPRCCGLPWYRAARVGAVWGMGHGVSATLLGMAGYLFKRGMRLTGLGAGGYNLELLHRVGSFTDLAIGASLVVIGLLGIKEAREWVVPEGSMCDLPPEFYQGTPKSLSAGVVPEYATTSMAVNPNPRKSAVLFNGVLHGLSWDGMPSLAPAVAISTFRGSLTFLLSYALGTMGAMALATTVIGEGTRRAAGKLDRPDLPRDLSVVSSFLALAVGAVWCGLALR